MSDVKLSQYYTESSLWDSLVPTIKKWLKELLGDAKYTVVDPCAGNGYLVRTHFPGGYMFDIDPKAADVRFADMDLLDYSQFGPNTIPITNQPFSACHKPMGKMDRAAFFPNVPAFISMLPTRYEQYPVDSFTGEELNKYFHLVNSRVVDNTMFFNHMTENGTGTKSKLSVNISLQMWVRKPFPRTNPADEMEFETGLPSHIENPDLVMVLPNKRFVTTHTGGEKVKGRGRKGKCKSPVSFKCGNDKLGTGRSRIHVRVNEKARYTMKKQRELFEFLAVKIYRECTQATMDFGPGYLYAMARKFKVLQRSSR